MKTLGNINELLKHGKTALPESYYIQVTSLAPQIVYAKSWFLNVVLES